MPKPFAPVTKAAWLAKVEKDLKGKPLTGLDFELAGETLSPFWHREDLPVAPPPLRQKGGWAIGVTVTEQDPARANQLALAALMGGAESLWFHRRRPLTDAERETILKDVLTDIVQIVFDEEESKSSRGNPALDLYHASLNPDAKARLFVPHHADFFQTLATTRALRRCWAGVGEAYGRELPLELVAFVPAPLDDVHTNKIAQTVNALALVAGGVDTLYLAPSDPADKTPFSARIARNVQHLLREEARLGEVADAAAGSYFLENLTDRIGARIWENFGRLHRQNASQP